MLLNKILPGKIKNIVFFATGRINRSIFSKKLLKKYFNSKKNILFYHAVWKDGDPRTDIFGGMEIKNFCREMEKLAHLFQFVPLPDLLESADGGSHEKPRIAITFDDGFDLIGSGAANVLDKFNAPSTVFINSDAIFYKRLIWQHAFAAIIAEKGEAKFVDAYNKTQCKHKLGKKIKNIKQQIYASKKWPQNKINEFTDEIWSNSDMPSMKYILDYYHPYMDSNDVIDWLKRGHFIGFHTKTHPFSSNLAIEDLDREIFIPAQNMKNIFGIDEFPFAYPFGDRLPPNLEQLVIRSGMFTGLLGTAGLSAIYASPYACERVDAEPCIDRSLFGQAVLRDLFRKSRTKLGNPLTGD